jgi:hypothetical protein
MKCEICEQETSGNDARLGVCWWCAETESIIVEGLDMDGNGLDGGTDAAASAMDKVRLMKQRGLLVNRRTTG